MIGREIWNILKLPNIPKIKCGCGSYEHEISDIHVFVHHDTQYRMDIHTVCTRCCRHKVYGVHLTENEFTTLKPLVLKRVVKMDVDVWDTSVKPPRLKIPYKCGCGCTEHYFKQLIVYDDYIQLFTKCKRCGSVKQFDISNYNNKIYKVGEVIHYSSVGHILVTVGD